MNKPPLPEYRQLRKLPRNLWSFIGDNWLPLTSLLVFTALVGLLLGVKLVALTQFKLSANEAVWYQHLIQRDLGLRTILHNPINLPFQLMIYGLEKLHISSMLALRTVGALFGALTIGAFYLLLKNWHTRRVAILGTVLFACSAWTLHISRLATPEILLMLPMVLILCATWLEVSYKRKWTLLLCLLASMLLMYIPGMAVFVIVGIVWQARRLYDELRQTPLWFVVPWLLLGVLLLVPLIWMAATEPKNIITWLGLPQTWPAPRQLGVNLLSAPKQLAIHGPNDPARWLGGLPLLDLFTGLMFILGIYAYAFRFRLDRTKLLAGIFGAGTVLIALGGSVTISFLMPFVYIVVAGGITLMLQQWATVFPRNPFAKTLATTLMSIVVLMAAFYNLNHYFIAWPNAPETRQSFSQR